MQAYGVPYRLMNDDNDGPDSKIEKLSYSQKKRNSVIRALAVLFTERCVGREITSLVSQDKLGWRLQPKARGRLSFVIFVGDCREIVDQQNNWQHLIMWSPYRR